jgi:Ca2+-binding RTX toxin-like protein
MSTSSNYSTFEVTSTSTGIILPPGAACEAGKYRLLGYSSSPTSFAAAASSTLSTSSPTFWNLNNDQYVIVWNEKCSDGGQNPPPQAGTCPAATPNGYTRVNGTVGNDTITLHPNTMYVDPAGNDKISGPDGNYVICSGSGNDTINLGHGDSAIYSGTGNDEIMIGNGASTIYTDTGNDTVVTGNGNHTIVTDGGNDDVLTGSGVDTIDVGNGNNKVNAGGGNDSVVAGNGNDKINGGAGTDTCNAGGGNNTVTSCEL